MIGTIFKNIFDINTPYFLSIDKLLERIEQGKSKDKVELIRQTLDKGKRNELKKDLPCVVFSGKYQKRTDNECIEPSGFIVLDFDNLENLRDFQTEIISSEYCYACWVSPSGDGLKALFRIADPKKHREHFADEYNVCEEGCVNDCRDYNETPEQLLERLNKTP